MARLALGGRVIFRDRLGQDLDVHRISEPERRLLMRTDWAFVLEPRGLRMGVSTTPMSASG